MLNARCRTEQVNPEYFFPGRGQLLEAEKARFFCSTCPVIKECEEYRERTDSRYGIWAGKFAYEKGEK